MPALYGHGIRPWLSSLFRTRSPRRETLLPTREPPARSASTRRGPAQPDADQDVDHEYEPMDSSAAAGDINEHGSHVRPPRRETDGSSTYIDRDSTGADDKANPTKNRPRRRHTTRSAREANGSRAEETAPELAVTETHYVHGSAESSEVADMNKGESKEKRPSRIVEVFSKVGHKKSQSMAAPGDVGPRSPLESLAVASANLAGVGSANLAHQARSSMDGGRPAALGGREGRMTGLRVQTNVELSGGKYNHGEDHQSASTPALDSGVTTLYSGGSSQLPIDHQLHSAGGAGQPPHQHALSPAAGAGPPPTTTTTTTTTNNTNNTNNTILASSTDSNSSHKQPISYHRSAGSTAHAAPAPDSSSQLPAHPPQPPPHHRTSDPLDASSSGYTAYRPPLSTTATAPAVPSMNNPRASTGGQYSSNPPSLTTSTTDTSSGSGRKYTHPGALTPTYTSAAQSHAHAPTTSLNSHLAGLTTTSATRDDPPLATGATGPGRWMCPSGLYAIDWCKWPVAAGSSSFGRIAIGSYSEDSHNYIQILDTRASGPDPHSPGHQELQFVKLAEASSTYPITRVLWEPPSSKPITDLLATSGDHLRLWSLPSSPTGQNASNTITAPARAYPPQKLTPLALLSNSKSTDFTAPLTSLDWNTLSPSLIITSSIDTTCTIWDIPTLTAKTQLIAHDKEVFDVRFMSGSVDVFASCGADGSVRMFDLRSLEHSTIIYEPAAPKPASATTPPASPAPAAASPPALLRLAASPHDQHLLATFSTDSNVVRILDVRQPGQALVELRGHSAAVNCAEWNPSRRGVIAAGADDCAVLVWDVNAEKKEERAPVAAWEGECEIGNLSWAPGGREEWLCAVGGRGVYALGL